MDVGFGSAGLAALCSSERRLADRWGPVMGRTVGRRLLDLSAATPATLERIPSATVSTDGNGETTMTFDDVIVMRGALRSIAGPARTADPDQYVISSIEIKEVSAR
jgi:hypothetical protein